MSLVVEGLTVRLARQGPVLVDSVSLQIEAGEVLCLVGESGAGKSLLCRAVAGLLEPPAVVVAGRVFLAGSRIDNLNAQRMRREVWGRGAGLLLQNPGDCLDPAIPVGAQLTETLTAHGRSGAAAKAEAREWLERVGLPDPDKQARSYAHQLSGGMKQRAALALALCCGPRVLLADEPTSALDAITRRHVVTLLRSLCAAQGTALLLVTHDLQLARAANRIAVFYAGKILETGPSETVLGAPVHPYTRALVECLRRIGDRRPEQRLTVIDGAMPGPGAPSRIRGCVFAPRCRVADERCASESPPVVRRGGGGEAACWRPGDE